MGAHGSGSPEERQHSVGTTDQTLEQVERALVELEAALSVMRGARRRGGVTRGEINEALARVDAARRSLDGALDRR